MYQFFVNTPDEQVGELLRFLTFFDHDAIGHLDSDTATDPAAPVGPEGPGPVRGHHGARGGRGGQVRGGLGGALRRGDRRSQRGDAAGRHRGRARRPPCREPRSSTALSPWSTLLERTGLAKSKADARRTIDQGGAYVNNVRQTDGTRTLGKEDLLHDRYIVLRKGPRAVHIVRAT